MYSQAWRLFLVMTVFKRYLDTIYIIVDGFHVGHARLDYEDKPCLYVSLVKIKKRYRRKGYGKLLVNYITDTFINYESVSLYVSIYNPNAIALYRKCGFFISYLSQGEHPHYLMTYKLT